MSDAFFNLVAQTTAAAMSVRNLCAIVCVYTHPYHFVSVCRVVTAGGTGSGNVLVFHEEQRL